MTWLAFIPGFKQRSEGLEDSSLGEIVTGTTDGCFCTVLAGGPAGIGMFVGITFKE